MTIILGLVVTLGCMLGGFMAMGGHVSVIWQPWEYVIICGAALGTFIVANPMKTIRPRVWAIPAEGFGCVCARIALISAITIIRFEAGKSTHRPPFGKRLWKLCGSRVN